MPTTDDLLRELLKEQRKANNSSPGVTSLKANDLASAGKAAVEFGKTLMDGGSQLLGTFQDVSKSGASFSTDLLGMGKAALGSRLSLQEFADVVKSNSTSFAAMGGNVTRGAEAFSKLSKTFFEDKQLRAGASEMRDLGYTAKDLNEILALTAGAQKSAYRDDAESRRKTAQSAQDLAREMDAIAKLTGKSREEQMEEMKKRKVDGQVEAKLRLMTEGKSAEEARKIRDEYLKMEMAARKRGDEQAFKEYFATGTYLTKAAATQRALLGDQATAYENSIKALNKGDVTKVREEQAKADAAAVKNAGNRTLLTVATFGDAAGQAGTSMKKFVEDTDAMYHAVKSVADQNGIILKTQQDYQAALKLALEDITKAQGGQRKNEKGQYEDVAATGRGLVTGQQAAQDAKAAAADVAEKLVKPGMDELSKLAIAYRETLPFLKMAAEGKMEAASPTDEEGRQKSSAQMSRESGGALGAIGRALQEGFKDVATMTVTGVTNMMIDGKSVSREKGSVGETGKIIEDFGKGTLAVLHGREGVVTEGQLTTLAKNYKAEGVTTAVQTMNQTVSGGGSTVTKRVQSDESKAAQAAMDKLKEQYKADRAEIQSKIKAELGPDAKFGDVMKQMNNSKEAQDLSASFNEKQAQLQKVIDAGITYEVEKKKEQVAETKKAVTEELEFVKFTNNKILDDEEDTEEEKAEIRQQGLDEETKRAAELAKSVVGTMVEGMSDTEIEKLIPKGADTDDFYIDMEGRLQSMSADAARQMQEVIAESTPVTYDDSVDDSVDGYNEELANIPSTPTVTTGVDLNKFDNMFGMGQQLKAKQKELAKPANKPAATPAATAEAQQEADNPTAKKSGSAAQTVASTATASKVATLDDVVKSLNSLNMLMGQLISKTEDIGNKQIKSTKSLSGNIYNG